MFEFNAVTASASSCRGAGQRVETRLDVVATGFGETYSKTKKCILVK
jgi:hypothetical protein